MAATGWLVIAHALPAGAQTVSPYTNPNAILPSAPISRGDTKAPEASTGTDPLAAPDKIGAKAPAGGASATPSTAAPAAAGATFTPGTPTPGSGAAVPATETPQTGTEVPGGNFSLDSPDGIIYDMERGLALARSKVSFKYREFQVNGDRGIIDYNTNRATIAGHLTVLAGGRTFRGSTLVFDLDSGKWQLSSLRTEFPPEFFPPGTVLTPIYVRDGNVIGQDDKVHGENFKVSSCDRDHYYLLSKRLEFYRTKSGEPERIVLHKNSLYVLGRRIAPLPVYVISLLGATTRRQPLQATFGQNTTDGYFVKALYDIRATPKLTDTLLVDALQKRGLGLGFQREYAAGAGLLYIYALSGQQGGREIDTKVDRTYKIDRLFHTNIKIDSTQNNSVTGEGVMTQSGQISLFRDGERAQTTAITSYNSSDYGLGSSSSSSVQLQHRQDFGSGFKLETSSVLNQSDSSFGSESATSDQSATLSKTTRLFDVFLRSEIHDDLTTNKSYQLERLPELTLQSTTDRLDVPGLKQLVPGDFTFGLGRFHEPSSDQTKDRADFYYTAHPRKYRVLGQGSSTSTVNATGTFEQAFYSDQTARYNYSFTGGVDNTLGRFSSQVNYSRQRTFGFTPFQFDFTTPGEYMDAALSYQVGQKFRLNLTGGRDIENAFTRDVVARVQYVPNLNFYSSLGTSYSPQTSDLGEIYGNFRIKTSRRRFGGGDFSFGVRYQPTTSTLTRVNSSVNIQLGAKTKVEGFAGYDGFAKTFDFSQVRVTRDMHCFNLYATYDGQRKEFRVDLALKAFPFADTRFGRNQFSEGFDPSVGDVQ